MSNNHLLVIAVLLLISYSSAYYWEKREVSRTLAVDEYFGLVYSDVAKEIRWKVVCSEKCTIYLLTYDEYSNFSRGEKFKYLHKAENSDSGSWKSEQDISKKLLILALNKGFQTTNVQFEIEQYIPGSQAPELTVAIIFIVLGTVGCCLCVCIITVIAITCTVCGRNRRKDYERQFDYGEGITQSYSPTAPTAPTLPNDGYMSNQYHGGYMGNTYH